MTGMPSLSARRAWIEMLTGTDNYTKAIVALRKESVDRNKHPIVEHFGDDSRSPQGERG